MSTILSTKRNVLSIFAAMLIVLAISASSVTAASWAGAYNFGFSIPGSGEVYTHADDYIVEDAVVDGNEVTITLGAGLVKDKGFGLWDDTINDYKPVPSDTDANGNDVFVFDVDDFGPTKVELDINGHPFGAMEMEILWNL